MRVALPLRDTQLRLSKGATGVPLFTTWDSVAGPGRTPMPGNNSGRRQPDNSAVPVDAGLRARLLTLLEVRCSPRLAGAQVAPWLPMPESCSHELKHKLSNLPSRPWRRSDRFENGGLPSEVNCTNKPNIRHWKNPSQRVPAIHKNLASNRTPGHPGLNYCLPSARRATVCAGPLVT